MWQWFLQDPYLGDTHRLIREQPQAEKPYADLAEKLAFMQQQDPDNGLPIFYRSWQAAKQAASAEIGGASGILATVVDDEAASDAVDLLRQAVNKPVFTMYGAEAVAEWKRIVGRPLTYAEAADVQYLTRQMIIPNIFVRRPPRTTSGRGGTERGEVVDRWKHSQRSGTSDGDYYQPPNSCNTIGIG